MIKIPQTTYPVIDVIKQRWSARAFADKAIGDTEMNTLFEAASWSSSSSNRQPWRYLYAHKGEPEFEQICETLAIGNQLWAKNAAVLVLSAAKMNFEDRPEVQNNHAFYDVGSANILLLLQAVTMGIYGHEMGGFSKEKVKEFFPIPEDWDYVCIIALGYLDEPESLEEPFRSRELTARSRKPLSEIVFKGQWGA